jgi:hypothetical protein
VFRFSIRDLLWLTLVVAMGLGWWVRERELGAEVSRRSDNATRLGDHATKWRMATGGLEDAISRIGWKVEWNVSAASVRLSHQPPSGNFGIKVYGDFCEPSAIIE